MFVDIRHHLVGTVPLKTIEAKCFANAKVNANSRCERALTLDCFHEGPVSQQDGKNFVIVLLKQCTLGPA